ncbi:MAG: hypothetical protein HFG54_14385 [Lachnospiraceae bacterium]|nr:hypothetical protein [Lachnospiraceae bacterium]
MEKLVEFFKDNILSVIIVVLGILIPGVSTVFLFNRELFINLDVIKLLILSACITTNSFVTIMFVVVLKSPFDYPKYVQMQIALMVNILIFLVMLLIKVFWRNLSIEQFIIGIILLFGVFSFSYRKIIK